VDWIDIREKHLKLSASALTAIVFLKINWGSTLAAIKHVVLSARAHSFDTVEGELASELSAGVLPFGQTVAHLLVCGLILSCFFFLIPKLGQDCVHDKFKIKQLLQENESLKIALSSMNTSLFNHLEVISKLEDQHPKLERHHDQIQELTVQLEACNKKSRPKEQPKQIETLSEPDLFRTGSKGTPKTAKPPKRRYSVPKF